MKYQIIVESNEVLADDEFQKLIEPRLAIWPTSGPNIVLIYAQNLEGIRKELWEKRDNLRAEVANETDQVQTTNEIIDSTFDEISELFKL